MLEEILKLRTPLYRSKNLERFFGVQAIYLKYEGTNPTKTHKDRAAQLQVLNAVTRGYDKIVVGTCGNYGVAISYYARKYGIKAVIYVPRGYSNKRIGEMKRYGSEIVFVEGSYENAVLTSIQDAYENNWYDANPGSMNSEYSIEAYKSISEEIISELGTAPDTVVVPVGNGTTLAGIYLGFLGAYKRGVIEKMPRFIGTTTILGNPVLTAYEEKLDYLPVLENVVETETNEPLVSRIALDGKLALEAIRNTGGSIIGVSDNAMKRYKEILERLEGICVLPASASTLSALQELVTEREKLDGVVGQHVFLLTGGCVE